MGDTHIAAAAAAGERMRNIISGSVDAALCSQKLVVLLLFHHIFSLGRSTVSELVSEMRFSMRSRS